MSDERNEMTQQELDELVSAYLDGEATAEEAALVSGDASLQARVEELRAVKALVAAPVDPPSEEVRDQMVAQALAQHTPVVSLEKARTRWRRPGPRTTRTLLAAAVIGVVAISVVSLSQQYGGSDDDAPTMAVASDDSDDAAAADSPIPESSAMGSDAPAMAEEPMMADDGIGPAEEMPAAPPTEDMPAEAPEEEMAVTLVESSGGDDSASERVEAPMDDDAGELMASESPDDFETPEDLREYATRLANDYVDRRSSPLGDLGDDGIACPFHSYEGFEPIARFVATVEGTPKEVSVYTGDDQLLIAQTQTPPECEESRSHEVIEWLPTG